MLKTLKFCLVLYLLTTFASAIAQSCNTAAQLGGTTSSTENATPACKESATTIHNLIEKCKELSIDTAQIGILTLVVFAMATITHESGHAIACKYLFDLHNPIHINIGTTNPWIPAVAKAMAGRPEINSG